MENAEAGLTHLNRYHDAITNTVLTDDVDALIFGAFESSRSKSRYLHSSGVSWWSVSFTIGRTVSKLASHEEDSPNRSPQDPYGNMRIWIPISNVRQVYPSLVGG
ncbi:hypothetical protein K503DRAFT_248255 [Rhizopogon vinicolor AM-OR11-026]|uniref:XPG-I domain-containing protein n=1 Tax=Rhizopogon vinicolor AM-OR11-026 TaxID=1314800 RepID=A0A1B7MX69_9AGAM|nr:hypothetical protein K503DRAFT_248255 [Rhizopogon vinicolor AM-OR11-026]